MIHEFLYGASTNWTWLVACVTVSVLSSAVKAFWRRRR